MSESVEVVFFEMRGRRCALPVASVVEVAEMPYVTPVPLAGPSIRGVVPLHGHALPLVDLGNWFSVKPRGEGYQGQALPRVTEGTILVIETAIEGEPLPVRFAVPVDRVLSVGTVGPERSWEPSGGPVFVSAAVIGSEGPTLLIDPASAVGEVLAAVRREVAS